MNEQNGEDRPRLVEVLESEDGETGWATGEIEPALMVLSAVANRAQLVGAIEAIEMLLGVRERGERGEKTWRETDEGQIRHANDMLASVGYYWLREDPENDENMLPAEPHADGATLYTRVDLPW